MPLSFELTENEKKFLCRQAALAIDSVFSGQEAQPLLPVETKEKTLFRDLGSFVTITEAKALRGCIGTITAHDPLYLNVWNMARAAAFRDPRFPPLAMREWQRCQYEISVLDEPAPCPDVQDIVIGRDGLILQWQGRAGVFLPQVPVEQGWDVEEYLLNLCRKGGMPPFTWQKPDALLLWYQASVFSCSD